MASTLHWIGGGPGALLALRRHLKTAIAALRVKKPLVAYVGTASGDNAGFFRMIGATFAWTGANVRAVKLASKTASVASARSLLEDADAVFV